MLPRARACAGLSTPPPLMASFSVVAQKKEALEWRPPQGYITLRGVDSVRQCVQTAETGAWRGICGVVQS